MLNRCQFIGNLGHDLELRHTQSGVAVTNMRIACSEKWTDNQGRKQERVEWVPIAVFGKTAELCAKYLSKGRQVMVTGRFQTRKYTDKDGIERYVSEVVSFPNGVLFLGGPRKEVTEDQAPEGDSTPETSTSQPEPSGDQPLF